MLARRKPSNKGQRLSSAQSLTRGPLNERRAEKLCARTFGEKTHLEAAQNRLLRSIEAEFLGAHLGEHCPQHLWPASPRSHDQSHLVNQAFSYRIQCGIRN